MAVYKCTACGYLWDEDAEGQPFSALARCPLCECGPESFVPDRGIDIPLARSSPEAKNRC